MFENKYHMHALIFHNTTLFLTYPHREYMHQKVGTEYFLMSRISTFQTCQRIPEASHELRKTEKVHGTKFLLKQD